MSQHYVVQFSSGITSWAAARRVVDQCGKDAVTLLFADTLIEDEDNYRFLDEASANLEIPVTRIADGRSPWQVFRDERFIGNSRVDPCSKILKRKLLRKWMEENTSPETHTIVLGIDFEEPERLVRNQIRQTPWKVIAPMVDKPWIPKPDTLRWANSVGLKPPRLYDYGFSHANCGGFCVKAGQDDFRRLLVHFPERYAAHEAEEAATISLLGQDVSILRDRRGGVTRPMTMREFRERYEATGQYDAFDFTTSCGCSLF